MQSATSKFRKVCAVALAVCIGVTAVPPQVKAADDAPIKIQSATYGIESFFFGSTGVVYSYSASLPPVITSGPTVTGITETEVTVNWTTDKQTNSLVYLGSAPGVYNNQIGQVDTYSTTHNVQIDRLTKGTTYYSKIRSTDVDGNVVDSGEFSFTTDPGDITAPVITVGPLISIDSASLVTISWTTDEVASSIIEYGEDNVTENSVGRAEDLTLFHQVKVSGLTPSQAYFWRAKSRDAAGNSVVSATQRLATPNSPFISGFTITDVTLTSAVVQWNTSTASTTKVEYGTATSEYTTELVDATFSTNHIVRLTGLGSGTIYYLKVSGVDQAGNLLQSDEKVFATVVIPQITDLLVSEITENTAKVTWKSSSPVDEFLRYEILEHPNPEFVGKKGSGGNDLLSTEHTYDLTDLESSTVYTLAVIGKDVFGNQAVSGNVRFTTPPDSTRPSILSLRSDTTIDLGSRQTVQVLVSLELSEPAKVVIDYGPGASGDYEKQVVTDTIFSRAKFLVIPGLQPGQSYHFRVVVKDRVGNEDVADPAQRPDYLVLAPAQPVSLLDLIFGQIRANFGWLGNL
ncbi:hypothetical protein BH11PAT4_BH11PAT4_0020 [soil metagenome]